MFATQPVPRSRRFLAYSVVALVCAAHVVATVSAVDATAAAAVAPVTRAASGRVSARDLTAIIGAGLRGGGNAVTDDELARMAIEGGLVGAADIAARLLRATFGGAA